MVATTFVMVKMERQTCGSNEDVIAAVVQAAPVFLDLDRSVDKAVRLIGEAAEAGARLVAFPELWLPGYPWWIWLAPPVWAARHGIDVLYREQAFRYHSVHADRIAAAARDHGIIVVMGLAERDGASLYIGQWVIDDKGCTVGTRRKLKPGAIERPMFGEGDAGDLSVWQTSVGRVGALCCGEHRQPLFKYALHSQTEDIHVAAWPSFAVYQPFAPGVSPDTNLALSRSYAAEGGCYVLAPSAPTTAEMRNLVCDTEEKMSLLGVGGGHAQIFGPDGDALCTPLAPDEEGILTATICRARISAAKGAYDVTGHSARPDVVQLLWTANAPRRPLATSVNPVGTSLPE